MKFNEIEKATFEDVKNNKLETVLEELKKNEDGNHLLMANGVSMDFDPNSFAYKSLKKYITRNMAKWIRKDNNFENAIKLLDAYKIVLDSKILKFLPRVDTHRMIEKIREALLRVITENHPEKSSDISDDKYKSFGCFLNHFNSIFTLNYDLLVYWFIAKYKTKFKDGFKGVSKLIWNESNEQNYFPLHGSLLTFVDNKYRTLKISYKEKPIGDEIKTLIDSEKFPICVTEGNSEAKLARINNFPYLKNSYNKISDSKGNIIIIGSSFNENELHIYEKFFTNSNITNFYIGCFNENDFNSFKDLITKINDINETAEFTFFNSKTDLIWRNKNSDFELIKNIKTEATQELEHNPSNFIDSKATKNNSNKCNDDKCTKEDCPDRTQ